MPEQKKALRVGMTALMCALIFRFFSPGIMDPLLDFLSRPGTVAFLIYAETGHRVNISPAGEILPEQITDAHIPYFHESPAPALQEDAIPVFSDADLIEVDYSCSYRPDIPMLLQKPLDWNLREDFPTVLIYHTHGTESFQRFSQDYEETAAYRTLNTQYNIVSIGDRVTELLEENGISVIHDREIHDYPDYNSSYLNSRIAAKKLLKENPGVLLALDIHRDAVEGPDGKQMKTAANLGGSTAAQIMIIVGTNCRMPHNKWPANLSLGLKLQAQLQNQTPGIVRPLCLRPQRFNQDLNPGALLIEVGSAGNSHGEAMLAAQELASAIIALAGGTATADCGSSAADSEAWPADDF